MIVTTRNRLGDEVMHVDVDALVLQPRGIVYICRDGQPDEYLSPDVSICAVNS